MTMELPSPGVAAGKTKTGINPLRRMQNVSCEPWTLYPSENPSSKLGYSQTATSSPYRVLHPTQGDKQKKTNLVLYDKKYVFRDKKPLPRDKKPLPRDKKLLLRDKKHFLCDKKHFLCDKNLLLRDKKHFLCDKNLLLRDKNESVNSSVFVRGHSKNRSGPFHPRSFYTVYASSEKWFISVYRLAEDGCLL